MAKRLFHEMYLKGSVLFGLRHAQTRYPPLKICHNAYWYDKDGEYLAVGDLDADDFLSIRDGLEDGELFIIVREGEIVRSSGTNHHSGDVDWIAAHCGFIIRKGFIYTIGEDLSYWNVPNLPLPRSAVRNFIGSP